MNKEETRGKDFRGAGLPDIRPGAGNRKARAKRAIMWLFFALVAALLTRWARTIDWGEVFSALSEYRGHSLAMAAVFTFFSYLIFVSYDLLAKRRIGHGLPNMTVAAIAFTSYSFNLSLGAWVGGLGLRYLLYSRAGLEPGVIARITAFSIFTNWSGYVLLTGAMLILDSRRISEVWGSREAALLSFLGTALLLTTAVYVTACIFLRGREWRIYKWSFELPSAMTAFVQLSLSSLNWLTITAVLHTLLTPNMTFREVLTAYLFSGLAGSVTHVPAGLGVIEGVFLLMTGDALPDAIIVAALLAFRGVFYLLPLLLGIVVFAALQSTAFRNILAGVFKGSLTGRARS